MYDIKHGKLVTLFKLITFHIM